MTPEQAANNYHWIKFDEPTNTVEMYLDNFMLSSSRLCEAKFYLEHMLHLKPRPTLFTGTATDKIYRKPWFFDFGEFFHWCLEQFYVSFKKYKQAPEVNSWLEMCKNKWLEMRMDEYKNSIVKADVTKYEAIKGWDGVARLLCEYYGYFLDLRLRIIDTEITFGHNKEVFIGEFEHRTNSIVADYEGFAPKVMCYLTGRIDLLVDNGYKIGPVDHKTTASFDGYEHEDFNPHDGICGYILAVRELLKKYTDVRPVTQTGGWIHHIATTEPGQPKDKTKQKPARFKVTPIDKTLVQLEDYKQRQLSTFKRIAELLFNDKVPEWNTTACNNIFFRKCEYKPIHEQPSNQWQDIIDRFYQIEKPWDTRDHSNKENSTRQNSTEQILS